MPPRVLRDRPCARAACAESARRIGASETRAVGRLTTDKLGLAPATLAWPEPIDYVAFGKLKPEGSNPGDYPSIQLPAISSRFKWLTLIETGARRAAENRSFFSHQTTAPLGVISAPVRCPRTPLPTIRSMDAVCYDRFTSTPAVREASSASFDMIGFRLLDHDGRAVLGGQEGKRPT